MRRIVLLLALLVAPLCRAQNLTSVTSTVKDPSGTAYALGSYTISLLNTSNQQPQFGGNANFQTTYSGSLDSSGNLSIVLPSNAVITPPGTQWNFYICANPKQIASVFPAPVLPCFTSAQTVSGSTQVITFTAAAIPLPSNSSGSSAFSPQQSITVSDKCAVVTGNCYPVANTGRFDWQTTLANSSPTVTTASTAPVFRCPGSVYPCSAAGTGSDVGLKIQAANASTPGYTSQMTSVITLPVGTISSITSAHVATASTTAVSNAATLCGATPQVGCLVVWGPDESGALTTAFNALLAACGGMQLPGVNAYGDGPSAFLTTKALFNTASAGGSGTRATCSMGSEGARSGITIRGYLSSTFIIPTADFDPTTCIYGTSGKACFFTAWDGMNLEDINLFGAGISSPSTSMATNIVSEPNPLAGTVASGGNVFWDHVSLMNWGAGTSGILNCLRVNGGVNLFNFLNIDGCGKRGMEVGTGSATASLNVTLTNVSIFDNWEGNLLIQAGTGQQINVTSTGGSYAFLGSAVNGCDVSVVATSAANTSATFNSFGDFLGYNQGINNGVKQIGGLCVNLGANGASTGVAVANLHSSIAGIGTGNQTGSEGAFINTGGTIHACNSTFSGFGSGSVFGLFNSGTFFDDCPNILTGTSGGYSGSGAVFGSASVTGTACATGNWALTSGWGTSSIASVTAGGDSHRCQVVITGAAGSASPVLTWTFPKAYPTVAPGSCQISFNGTLTGESTGAPSVTSVAFTFTGTPSAQTYRLDASCGP